MIDMGCVVSDVDYVNQESMNSRVHIQNAGNVAVILPMHIGKHLFHARSDTVHIDKKSAKLP